MGRRWGAGILAYGLGRMFWSRRLYVVVEGKKEMYMAGT